MNQFNSRFEIIEDEGPEAIRKRKRKNKDRLSFNYMPWRLIAISLTAGMTVGIVLIFLLTRSLPSTPPAAIPNVVESNDTASINRSMAPIVDIAFFDNNLVAVSSLNVHIYQGDKLTQVLDLRTPRLIFSPDGKLLASVGSDNGKLQLWDVATGKVVKEVPISGDSNPTSFEGKNIAYSSDGRLLAIGTREGTMIWDTKTLTMRTGISENNMGTTALVFSADKHRLTSIVAYMDPATNAYATSAKVWDIQTPDNPRLLYSLTLDEAFAQYAVLSPDGQYLAYVSRHSINGVQSETLHIHDMTAQKDVGTLPVAAGTHVAALALSDTYLAFEQRGIVPTGDQNSLRVVRWSVSGEGISIESVSEPQPVRTLGISHLRLWSENGSTGLDYLALDTSTILRWNFASNSIRPLPL